MSFINRKITSRATFAVFLTATILASCSSDDSSSTGRLKNSIGADGQLCYTDDERASLLLGAVAIPAREAIAYQPAVEARAAVEYKAAVQYQAPKKATAFVPAKPEVPAVAYQAPVAYQPGVPYQQEGFYDSMGNRTIIHNKTAEDVERSYGSRVIWIVRGQSFSISPLNYVYTYRPERQAQNEVLARAEVLAQAAIPAQDEIPAGDEIPEVLASDEVLAQDAVPAQDEVLAQEAQPGKTLEVVKAEINSVKKCADETVSDNNNSGGDSAGDSGGDSSGDSGGDSAGDSGGDSAGDSGGDSAGDSAGDSGGDSSGDSGGDSGGDSAGDSGGDSAGDSGGDSGGDSAGDSGGDSGGDSSGDSGGDSGGDSAGDSSNENPVAPAAAPSGPPAPVCISGADKDSALAGYDEQLKVHEKDADLSWYNNLLNGRNNVAGREICTGTEVSKVVIVAVQTKVDQPIEQASVPAAVLTVEKPVVLLNEPVKEVVVEPTEVQELVTSAGFVEGTVEMQVENADGFSDWLMIDPVSSNTVALGDGAKSINYRVTSKDKSQPVVEKTVEIKRLSVSTAVKVATSDQLALTPTVEEDSSSTSKQTMFLVGFGAVLLILLLIFFARKKKKVDENASKVA
jgi:LPXTG-motif cell wall-anchored protein